MSEQKQHGLFKSRARSVLVELDCIMGCPSVQRPPVTAKAHLFADRPLVFPVLEAAAGQRVDAVGLAQLHVLHLCVQEALKGQLLVFIVYRGRCLHLGRG